MRDAGDEGVPADVDEEEEEWDDGNDLDLGDVSNADLDYLSAHGIRDLEESQRRFHATGSGHVVSIDVGVTHLAFVSMVVENWKIRKVKLARLVDLTNMRHVNISLSACRLYHSKLLCDRVDHFIQEYEIEFEDADLILIERQPPVGGASCVVEQLLVKAFRDKIVLVSPTSMHCFFGIQNLDYDARKDFTTRETFRQFMHMALSPMSEFNESVYEYFKSRVRKHDIADAMCLAIYYFAKQNSKSIESEMRQRRHYRIQNSKLSTPSIDLQQFAYQK